MHTEIGGYDADSELDRRRLLEIGYYEYVEHRGKERRDRCYHAEEQVCHIRRLAAVAGLHKLHASLFLADPALQIELVDDCLHILLWRLAQRDLLLLLLRHALALALADLVALE